MGLESGEVLIDAVNFDRENHQSSCLGLDSDESSEVVLEAFVSDSRSLSRSSAAVKSSVSMAPSVRSESVANTDQRLPSSGTLGRFRIGEILGEGQHATVYCAYDPVLERDVALKVPRQGVIRSAKGLERFLGEAKALARLRHPQIVPVYEAGCAGGRHYMAMALIHGSSLAQQMAERPFEVQRAAEIVAELAEALGYAHSQGVVHRDVKPANIRLDGQGVVFVMDFSIAYRPDSGEMPLPPGVILGTPAYVAPEQAQGGQTDVLPASDQYSLGAVFYELLSGQPPFTGPPSYVLFHTIHHDPPSLHTIAPRVPPRWPQSVKRPSRRNPSIAIRAVGILRRIYDPGSVAKPRWLAAVVAAGPDWDDDRSAPVPAGCNSDWDDNRSAPAPAGCNSSTSWSSNSWTLRNSIGSSIASASFGNVGSPIAVGQM